MIRTIAFIFIAVLVASSLVIAGSVSAQSVKPGVTNFRLEYVDNSYYVAPSATSTRDLYTGEVTTSTIPGYRVENKSIVVTIRNPPDVDAYNFRWKDHNGGAWHNAPFNPDDLLPFRISDSYGIDARASASEYTELSLLFIPKTYTSVDIQVQALYGDYRANPYVHVTVLPFDCPTYDFYFDGQASYWSHTETIDLTNTQSYVTTSPAPTTTQPTPTATATPTVSPTVKPSQSDTQMLFCPRWIGCRLRF